MVWNVKGNIYASIKLTIILVNAVLFYVLEICPNDFCQNAGTCRESTTQNFECDCAPGFSGDNCQNGKDLLWLVKLVKLKIIYAFVVKGIFSKKHEVTLVWNANMRKICTSKITQINNSDLEQ